MGCRVVASVTTTDRIVRNNVQEQILDVLFWVQIVHAHVVSTHKIQISLSQQRGDTKNHSYKNNYYFFQMLESYHMRIGVDYRLANRHLGGMAVYLKNLISRLKEIDTRNQYILFDDNPSGAAGFKKNVWTIVWEHIWLQMCLPYFFWKEKIDMAFFPNPPVSFFLRLPIVLTIPDASFLQDPTLPWWTKLYLWAMYYLSAHKAKTVTTFSENSKKDITHYFWINRTKIVVTPLAASNDLSPSRTKKRYILSVPGTLIARKNIKDTIQAFNRLPKNLRKTYQLVIVGHGQSGHKQSQGIIFPGRVSDKELADLYAHAKLFVCSSLYEGFGLPILEAMQSGTPVISYGDSSLSEVVGDSGILVNNVKELSKQMQNVLQSPRLQTKFRNMGLRQAKLFTWSKTATIFYNSLPINVK